MKLTRTLQIQLVVTSLGIFVLSLLVVPMSNWPHTSELLYCIVFYINEPVYCRIVPYSMSDLKQYTSKRKTKNYFFSFNIYRHFLMKIFIMFMYAAELRANVNMKNQFSVLPQRPYFSCRRCHYCHRCLVSCCIISLWLSFGIGLLCPNRRQKKKNNKNDLQTTKNVIYDVCIQVQELSSSSAAAAAAAAATTTKNNKIVCMRWDLL